MADQLAAAILDWRTSGARSSAGRRQGTGISGRGASHMGHLERRSRSVRELADVLGMTPDLFARMAPHLTVLTDGDPDMSTRDPVVARALTDAAGVADDHRRRAADRRSRCMRLSVTRSARARLAIRLWWSRPANFQSASPRVNILLRERGSTETKTVCQWTEW